MDNLKHKTTTLYSMLALESDVFYQHLCSLTPQPHYLIAYSGGLDSHVLLHLLSRLQTKYPRLKLRSVYVDHRLQALSTSWATHCQHIATSLGIPHQTLSLNLTPAKGQSVEAIARDARYQALAPHLHAQETLLTAQHQDDQAETLLIQLLRGSGLDGLAAMPESTPFAQGYHARPLLNTPQSALEAYAKHYQLNPITDPSNADCRFDRNYLRHHITPVLKQRWPEMAKTLTRAARFQAEASQLLATYVSKELKDYKHKQDKQDNTLSVIALKQTGWLKQKALLREWIKTSGFPAPSEIKLQHIISDVIESAKHTQPIVHWQQTEIRRYQDALYIMSPLLPHNNKCVIHWDNINKPLVLANTANVANNIGTLLPHDLGALKPLLLAHNITVTIRFRQGGEKIRSEKRRYHLSLKNLLQEAAIPPWQRQRIPLIYGNEQLIQVLGLAKINPNDLNNIT